MSMSNVYDHDHDHDPDRDPDHDHAFNPVHRHPRLPTTFVQSRSNQ